VFVVTCCPADECLAGEIDGLAEELPRPGIGGHESTRPSPAVGFAVEDVHRTGVRSVEVETVGREGEPPTVERRVRTEIRALGRIGGGEFRRPHRGIGVDRVVAALLGSESDVEGHRIGLNLVRVVDGEPPREDDAVCLAGRETVRPPSTTLLRGDVPRQEQAVSRPFDVTERSVVVEHTQRLPERAGENWRLSPVLVGVAVVDPDRSLDCIEEFDDVGVLVRIVGFGFARPVLRCVGQSSDRPDESGVVTERKRDGHVAEIAGFDVRKADARAFDVGNEEVALTRGVQPRGGGRVEPIGCGVPCVVTWIRRLAGRVVQESLGVARVSQGDERGTVDRRLRRKPDRRLAESPVRRPRDVSGQPRGLVGRPVRVAFLEADPHIELAGDQPVVLERLPVGEVRRRRQPQTGRRRTDRTGGGEKFPPGEGQPVVSHCHSSHVRVCSASHRGGGPAILS